MAVLPQHAASREADLPYDGLAVLHEAVMALRRTAEVGTACRIAGDCVARSLGEAAFRLLRVDGRSGALRRVEEGDVETVYLAEPGGPVEWVLQHEAAAFDDGTAAAGPVLTGQGPVDHGPLLWDAPPAALAAIPLFSGNSLAGMLLAGFREPRDFPPADRRLLQTLADALALAMERSDLRRELDEERGRRVRLERRIDVEEETAASLMSLVAHEIRTPLTAIKAYTETLLQSLQNPTTPRERFLSIINDECERLARLVTDVLELSRLEVGQRPLRLARFELRTLVEEALAGCQPAAQVRRVTARLEVPAELAVEADRDLLRRLFATLVSNAVQFSPVGGEIALRAGVDGDTWAATVEDQGPGIPREELTSMFERLHPVRRPGEHPPVEGNGLGLTIARGIVELHGGRLWAECPPAGGTRFHVRLPLRQLASAQARHIARAVVGRGDLRRLFDETVEMVAATMDAGIVSLMLVDPERGDLFIVASRGLDGQNLSVRRTAVRSGVAGTVAAWAKPVLVNNIETDRRFQRLNHPQYSTKSLLSVPLVVEGEVLGVVNVNNKASGQSFDEHDLAVLVALVERVAGAVERAYDYPDSVRAVEDAIAAVRALARLREEGLLGSRDLVRRLRALAREAGMSEADVDLIGYVGTIHDVGMAPLRDRFAEILGPLGDDDRAALALHPAAGVEILRPIEYLGAARDIVLAHHEHWDGSGYPRGLAGEQIPPSARMLAVVEAYERIRSGRPYRPPHTRDEAIAELRRLSGRQFDPAAVEGLVRVLEREREAR